MKKIEFWIPAIFCAVISLATLIPIVFFARDISLFLPFLAFIPMCFYFVGIILKKTHKEITALRQEVDALKNNNTET